MLQIVSRPEVRASRLWAPASVHPSSLYGLALIYTLGSQGCVVILLVLCSVIFSQFILLIMVKSTVQSVAVGDSVIVKDSSGFHSGKVTSVSSAVVEITLADFNDDSGDSGAAVRLSPAQALTAARRFVRQEKIVNPIKVVKVIKKPERKPNRTRSIGTQTTDGSIKEGWIAWLRDDLEQTLLYDGVERLLKVNVPDVMSKLIKRVFDKEERLARGLAYRPDQSYSRTLY